MAQFTLSFSKTLHKTAGVTFSCAISGIFDLCYKNTKNHFFLLFSNSLQACEFRKLNVQEQVNISSVLQTELVMIISTTKKKKKG